MITDSDRAKYALPAKQHGKQSLIERADEAVDIRDIMKQMGLWAPTGDFYSYKIYCPWHDEHADQHDKNCRLFGGTNIYCWAGHGYIGPTYLYARWKAIPSIKAAEHLLDERGLLNKPWREKWNDLLDEREDAQHIRLGSKNDVIAALNTALALNSAYVRHEYSSQVRARWRVVLGVLDAMWRFSDTSFDQLNIFFNNSLTTLIAVAKMVDGDSSE